MPSDDAAKSLAGPVLVEEKLDGANLGFSVAAEGVLLAQNRGHYLHTPYSGQFARLRQWLAAREERLLDALGDDLIAFGEWCAARHMVRGAPLPCLLDSTGLVAVVRHLRPAFRPVLEHGKA